MIDATAFSYFSSLSACVAIAAFFFVAASASANARSNSEAASAKFFGEGFEEDAVGVEDEPDGDEVGYAGDCNYLPTVKHVGRIPYRGREKNRGALPLLQKRPGGWNTLCGGS